MKLGLISSHARVRMKRHGIPPDALEGLLADGEVEQRGHGGKVVYFSKLGRMRLGREIPQERLQRWNNFYAVLDTANEVITIGLGAGMRGRRNPSLENLR